jgi:cyclopropane fatty-acyl-phospholipid synthase-like methyltransferase
MPFSIKDIADYYNQTQIHYEQWWNLRESLAVHYGIWHEGTRDFITALENTNREMVRIGQIKPDDKILDAGCGVGGSAVFLAKEFNATIDAITLSEKQLDLATKSVSELGLNDKIKFSKQDFNHTEFGSESFDVVWACESSCYSHPKELFFREAKRLLKPGGTIVIADYFLTPVGLQDKKRFVQKWGSLWAIDRFYSWHDLSHALVKTGLELNSKQNFTREVTPSSKKMYTAARKGAFFSEVYNLFNNTSQFGKHHYKSGIYQYKALQRGEWEYWILCIQKPL